MGQIAFFLAAWLVTGSAGKALWLAILAAIFL
jgi:hypothetical protein